MKIIFGLTSLLKGRVKGHYKPSIGKFIPEYTTRRTKKPEQPALMEVPAQQKRPARQRAAKKIVTTPKGNKQYIYDEEHYAEAARRKLERAQALASNLPDIVASYDAALEMPDTPKEKVVLAIVALMDRCYFRIGSDEYAEKHGTYGVSTLKPEHVSVEGDVVQFSFTGKKQVEWDRTVTDPRLAAFVGSLQAGAPGDKLFWYHDDGAQKAIKSSDVNAYLKQFSITAKDFRTYHATRMAYEGLKRLSRGAQDKPLSKKEIAARIKKVVASVAEQLGHTVAVCKKSYILPQVLEHYTEHGGLLQTPPWSE